MLKQLILLLSLIQLTQCLSMRSNIWWSRRNDETHKDCDIEFTNENPSLEAKICGYCFAKCQQNFAACLLTQMSNAVTGSLEYCQNRSNKCEKLCIIDKHTSHLAEANWAKVVKILQQLHLSPSSDEEQKINQ
ncbi:unnamed protein product [Adineta steineri]|uniref:Saposin B-type domain-containing protein n=1 Tax=Adineta steineri TaxID=433720 RepID=A0A818RTH0_9BILA|nr:unnamed protein product [Adineta steineri]CAF1450582.1 unnamed protein product [Adineta steineri]CAF1451230.1 unnamed protein product [Adineta steineri]CAF1541600.1 unnamed protein product [Adineta steineri]CAF1657681.1 unnamed protein product [Adineta steineri]